MPRRYSISIPVLNQKETTQKCLDLLLQVTPPEVPIVIVDNGSIDSVREFLIGLRGGDQVVRNESNIGMTRALNQGWKVAQSLGSEYVIHLHNDVYVYEQDWIGKID